MRNMLQTTEVLEKDQQYSHGIVTDLLDQLSDFGVSFNKELQIRTVLRQR